MCLCMHQFRSITTNMRYFFQKHLFNFITELHNMTDWIATDLYCNCFNVVTYSSNVNWSDSDWHYAHNSVPFCTAIRNYKAAQYAISRQLKSRHQQFSSLNCVWFVSVRSGTANSSVRSFTFSAANRTVSSTVHKLYCRSEVFKYSTACSKMFSTFIGNKHIHKRAQL